MNDEILGPIDTKDAPSGEAIVKVCRQIAEMLLEKNAKYGDAALDPERIFSSADPIEQIDVRIDDKLSRIRRGHVDDFEDVIRDLAGYLVLRMVASKF